MRTKKLGEDNLYTVETLSAMAEIQLAQGEPDAAQESLSHTVQVRMQKLPKKDWRIAESQALLALIEKNNNPESNEQLIFNCKLEIVRKKLGKQHYRVQRLLQKQKSFKIQESSKQQQCTQIN